MSTTYQLDDPRLEDTPPSAKLVYAVLDRNEDPMTQQEIAEATMLPPRTTRHALTRLDEVDVVSSEPFTSDPRQKLYYINLTAEE